MSTLQPAATNDGVTSMRNKVHDLEFHRHSLTFHYRYVDRGPGPLFVSFPSVRPAGSTSVKIYGRTAWPRAIPCSFLFVADPQLQYGPHFSVSGFQGRPDWFAARDVATDILSIGARFSHPTAQMLFYGSSVGGLGAMLASSFLPSVSVIAECPQTDIRTCVAHFPSRANLIARICYDTPAALEIPARFDHRLSVAKAFETRAKPKDITVFVRASDKTHLELHAKPLVERFPDIKLKIMDDASGKGHTALAVDEVKPDILRALGPDSPSHHERLSVSA